MAASAYLSGSKLYSDYENRTTDYSHKPGVVHAELLLPHIGASHHYASMTAEWENQLLLIEKGQMDSGTFLTGIRNMITMMLNSCDTIPEEELCRFREKESIGVCPLCGKLVYIGRKNYYCSDRNCRFALWKENRYFESMKKTIDDKTAAALLKSGRVTMHNLYSRKKDKYFDADIIMKAQPDGKASFSMEFQNKNNNHDQ